MIKLALDTRRQVRTHTITRIVTNLYPLEVQDGKKSDTTAPEDVETINQ